MFIVKYCRIVLCCYFLLSHALFSQIIVQGVVADHGKDPVGNVLVEITDQADTNRTFSALTNAQGQYTIPIIATGIAHGGLNNPDAFQLFQNYPNPFNPSTVITYSLPHSAHINLTIYNTLGQKIRTLFKGLKSSGMGQVTWDGNNDARGGVPAGVYIYCLKSEGIRLSQKMLLVDGQSNDAAITFGRSNLDSPLETGQGMSDLFHLRITGDDILVYEQNDLEIIENATMNFTVIRIITDYDGNVYSTVKIGDQWWMAENLKVLHFRNGDAIPEVTDENLWSSLDNSAFCYWGNDVNHKDTYGILYNWYAVNDSREMAPEGWHVPGDEEWKELEMTLEMSQAEADGTGYRGTDEGGKLKETGIEHWISPNTGATDEAGFTALPGGYRSNTGYFGRLQEWALFWCHTENTGLYAWYRRVHHDSAQIRRISNFKPHGLSVRCVRD
jgi:uncharacterized protein (TIGR02145 family)